MADSNVKWDFNPKFELIPLGFSPAQAAAWENLYAGYNRRIAEIPQLPLHEYKAYVSPDVLVRILLTLGCKTAHLFTPSGKVVWYEILDV